MTAYARVDVSLEKKGSFLLEITSVNRKNLDIAVYAPRELSGIEIVLRKCIIEVVSRGSVTLRISRATEGVQVEKLLPSPENFKAVYDHLVSCCHHAGMSSSSIEPSTIVQTLTSTSSPAARVDSEDEASFVESLKEGLKELLAMGDKEGKHLQLAMKQTLDQMRVLIASIESIKGEDQVAYKDKLKKKIEQFDHELEEYEERIAREVILFSEKVDIEEELVRLTSHLDQFDSILEDTSGVKKGKRLEFLTQEIHRETNTIASKSQDIKLINLSLEVKGLTKTLVEQLQNIV